MAGNIFKLERPLGAGSGNTLGAERPRWPRVETSGLDSTASAEYPAPYRTLCVRKADAGIQRRLDTMANGCDCDSRTCTIGCNHDAKKRYNTFD
ncbi:MAG: hypothetical protein KAV00_06125, partial [Phycisphaerae bacterium]|nr:hypothetical protein [Phycisphaerae bacterium]